MTGKVLEKQDATEAPSNTTKQSKEPSKEPRVTVWVVVAIFTTVMGSGLPTGYCLGVINTPQEIIRSWIRSSVSRNFDHVLTNSEEISVWAVVVSIYVVGATLGSPLGPLLADKGGRRLGLFVNHLLFLIAGCLCIWCKSADSIYMLLFGRFISGVCSGLSSNLMPVYLSEVAPAALRGVMGVLLPAAMCLGVFLSQTLGMEQILGTQEYWPYLVGGFALPVLIALIMHPALPDSPAYSFIILEDEGRGKKALLKLRGGPSKHVESEESALRSLMSKNQYQANTWGLISMIKSEKYRLPLIIAMVCNLGQQFSGINAVFYYSTLIFQNAGLSVGASQGASIGAAGINWIVAMIAIPLIRYARRRVLLLCSIALSVVCQAVLLISLALIPKIPCASYFAIASLLAFVVAYNVGLGPVPFMIATELFPSGPRSIGISVGSTSNWLSNLIVGFTFPLIQAKIGEFSFTFYMLASCILWIFFYKLLPETLGKEEWESSQITSPVQDKKTPAPTSV